MIFAGWLFDRSPTPELLRSAWLVTFLLLCLSILIAYAVKLFQGLNRQRASERMLETHYPHVAAFRKRANM
jgi:hypothetical protein